MKKILVVLAVLVMVASAVSQQFQAALEITADRSGTIPIGIIMFQPTDRSEPMGDAQPWRVIASNLDFTGDFAVKRLNTLDSAQLLEEQIPVYITGTYEVRGDSMTLSIDLRDAGRHELLLRRNYSFHRREARAIAHRYSAEVYRTLLGENNPPYESLIVFVERHENGRNIVITDYDGHNRRQITNTGINIMPSFIDRSHLLAITYERGRPDVFEINIPTGKTRAIVSSRRVESSPNYSDIMGRIAYGSSKGGNMEIYTSDRNGDNVQRLTVNPPAISTAPNWSPDGFRIAFVSDRTGTPQIYTMTRTGTGVQRLTFGGNWHDSPSFSPDGTKIAYTAMRNGRNMIAVSSAAGGDEELITAEVRGSQEYPTWSIDGSHIIFTLRQAGQTDIYAIRLKDKRLTRITNSGVAEQSKWSNF